MEEKVVNQLEQIVSKERLNYIRLVSRKRVESDLRSFKFQKILDVFLEKEELSVDDEELVSRYEKYKTDLWNSYYKNQLVKSDPYIKMTKGLNAYDFIAKLISVKESKSCGLSKNDRDTLKIIYFLIKKVEIEK